MFNFKRKEVMSEEMDFMTYAQSLIDELERDGVRFGTARNYRSGVNSFRRFLEAIRVENKSGEGVEPLHDGELMLDDMTGSLMRRYSHFLVGHGLSQGTQSFYMRILQAIYNHGVGSGLCQQHSPFKNVYTGIPPTDNRSLEQDTLIQLEALELSAKPKLAMARDFFLFSYACCGMPFVDLAHLTRKNIRNGYIVYDRCKTRSQIKIKLNIYMSMIIDRYADPNSHYLFPILHSECERERYKEYRNGINCYNRQLVRLARLLGGSVRLTSYTARHTWANLAYQGLISMSVISSSLGHSSERMTRIYIDSLNNKPCDDANEELTRFLCEPLEKKGEDGKTPESIKEEKKPLEQAKDGSVLDSKENKMNDMSAKNNVTVENANMDNKKISKKENDCEEATAQPTNKEFKVSNLLEKKRQNGHMDNCRFLCKKSSKSAAKIKRKFKSSKFSDKK